VFDRFHEAFNRGFERMRKNYHGLLDLGPRSSSDYVGGDAWFRPCCRSSCFPTLVRTFFLRSMPGSFVCMCARRPELVSKKPSVSLARSKTLSAKSCPRASGAIILDNIGLTQSFTIMAYIDNGTVSNGDGEILVGLQEEHRPTQEYIARLRSELPKRFPGCTFYFEPADITSQILNFGLPAPIDVQIVGVNRDANLVVAHKLRQQLALIPGIADVHLHQMTDRPELRMNVDPRHGVGTRPDSARRFRQFASLRSARLARSRPIIG